MKILLLSAIIMAFSNEGDSPEGCSFKSSFSLIAPSLPCLLPADGSLWNFEKMIFKVTGNEGVSTYAFYDCYCGGKGSPKDVTDWCCFEHACCYCRLMKKGCGTKGLSYKVDYKGSQVICAKQQPAAPPSLPLVNQNSCRKQLCECDKRAALCFKKNKSNYNKNYQFYNKNCNAKAPQC